jgi:hypothetical protein
MDRSANNHHGALTETGGIIQVGGLLLSHDGLAAQPARMAIATTIRTFFMIA